MAPTCECKYYAQAIAHSRGSLKKNLEQNSCFCTVLSERTQAQEYSTETLRCKVVRPIVLIMLGVSLYFLIN